MTSTMLYINMHIYTVYMYILYIYILHRRIKLTNQIAPGVEYFSIFHPCSAGESLRIPAVAMEARMEQTSCYQDK